MAKMGNRLSLYALVLLSVLIGFENSNAQEVECRDTYFSEEFQCETIASWNDLIYWVNESVPGDELYLCPFDIDKGDQPVLRIAWGVSIFCVRKDENDSCILRGTGTFLDITTDDDAFLQGIHFRDTDDYAVQVSSTSGDGSETRRVFCHCTFSGISRTVVSRGGAFIAQKNAGIVDLLYCQFLENFSSTRGAAVYSRTNHMNIIGCQFIDNSSIEWGGAIFAARDTSLRIQSSTFIRNFGFDDYGVVVQPQDDLSVWVDGGENMSTGGSCAGFYVLAENFCQIYVDPEVTIPNDDTPIPTLATTVAPSAAPTTIAEGLCSVEENDLPCLQVDTFLEIKEAILSSPEVIFCGGFEIEKPANDVIQLTNDHEIRCLDTCVLNGHGTHMEVKGSQSQVRVHNFKFMLAESSAVRISTSSIEATTTFCNTQFFRNTANFGGAMWIARQSGFVNIVGSTFVNNEAVKGGAIYGGAQMLLIFESLFLSNVAFKAGSAVFTFSESAVVFHSSYFSQNTVSSTHDYAVVVKAGQAATGPPLADSSREPEDVIDAGENLLVQSGQCHGFYVKASKSCKQFGKREINTDVTSTGGIELAGNDVFLTTTMDQNSTAGGMNETTF